MDIVEGLNESQRRAVTTGARHLLIVAGPGTGKTTTIVRRIARLVEEGTPPDEIGAITFTNRAAREMRERIHAMLGDRAAGIFAGTFHLLGLTIIRQGHHGEFRICPRDDQVAMLKSIVGTAREARDAAERISRFKSGVEEPDDRAGRLYDAYCAMLLERGMYDFDDLIRIPCEMIEAAGLPPRRCGFAHIIVDEYQDVNPAQRRLLRALSRAASSAVCAVGDSDQAIYAFRGADIESFLSFDADFPDAQRVILEENYRSTGMITAAANGLIRHNSRRIEKKVIHRKGPGRPVAAVTCPDERMEAEVIAREIEARMGGTSHFRLMGAKTSADYSPTASSFSDFAVFFRTNAQIRGVRDALTEWGIPCQVVGEKQSAGVRDVAEALRKALGPGLAAHASFEALLDMAAGQVSLRPCDGSLLRSLVSTYRDMPLEEAVLAAIDELSLLGEGDAFDPRADAVALMTLHAAKGLEFAVAFIAGVEDGLLPFTLHGDEADIEEERRLFYVGMTRAKDELFLLHAASRFLYGKRQALPPSRFLSEIPPGAMRTEVAHGKGKGRPRGKQTSLF